MDPVSAIGSAGAVVGLIDVATRTLSYLRTLQQQWKLADLTLNLLIGQLSTLNAALDQISQWISTSLPFDQQHHQLVMDLGNALESCKALLICIDDHISALRWNENESLTFQSKARAILRDQNMKDLLNHLNNQSGALNLLLTALNWFVSRINLSHLSHLPDIFTAELCRNKSLFSRRTGVEKSLTRSRMIHHPCCADAIRHPLKPDTLRRQILLRD